MHLRDEPLSILAADEYLERVTDPDVGREGIVDDGVDDYDAASLQECLLDNTACREPANITRLGTRS